MPVVNTLIKIMVALHAAALALLANQQLSVLPAQLLDLYPMLKEFVFLDVETESL